MTSTSHGNALAGFLPWLHLETLSSRKLALTEHRVERFTGSVLFVDITGFSKITEQLSQSGHAGAEQLAEILNSYFGKMTEIITRHGGDVLSFAGDAVLGVWFDQSGEDHESACLAAQTGLAIQAELKDYRATEEVVLTQRASVGAGRLFVSELGGTDGRWKYFVAGEALHLAGAANEKSSPGDVVIATETWPQVAVRCEGVKTDDGVVKLNSVSSPCVLKPRVRPPTTQLAASLVGSYLPQVVQVRVEAGQSDWLAEFRRVSLMFIGLGWLDFDEPQTMATLQRAVELTQLIEQQYEGSILRFLMDDKGTTLILSFGLPPLAHEDDAQRAIRSGLALKERLNELGLRPSIGVTTGRAFCGACGSEFRRQYSIYGPVINLAARLMQIADGRLLCDLTTAESASKDAQLEFPQLPTIKLKGFTDDVVLFEPRTAQFAVGATREWKMQSSVGREQELEQIGDAVSRLITEGVGQCFVIEGEAGIGKSLLAEFALASASEANARCLVATADEIEKATPFFALRSVIRFVLNVDPALDPVANQERVLNRLSKWPELLPMASLLNLLLPFDIPEPSNVGAMSDEARAENRQEILFQLLSDCCDQQPLVLVVEDAQWLDSATWECLLRLAEPGNLLLIVATRLVDPVPLSHESLLAIPSVTQLRLRNLSPDAIESLVCERLGVDSIPEPVAQLIHEKAGGHPLFSKELAFMLLDVGLIKISGRKCRLVAAESETGKQLTERFGDQDLPSTVQGVVLRRLDRLPPEQLLTIKVASAIGQNFSLRMLEDVYPVEVNTDRLIQDLNELIRLEIIEIGAAPGDPFYRFKHAISLEVAYESMLYAQRRTLHQSVAQFYERVHAEELPRYYSVLAHHWQRSEVLDKAVVYLAKSGDQALASFANQEAVRFFNDAISLDQRDGNRAERFERAAWECRLGRAFVNWSKHAEGREHLEKGLVLFGHSIPKGFAAYMGLGAQVIRQFIHRTLTSRQSVNAVNGHARLQEAAQAYEALMVIYFSENSTEQSLYAALRSLNLAESAGPSAELARGYGAMGALVGIMGLRKSADRYLDRAIKTAQQVESPSAEAWVALSAGVYKAGLGDWPAAVPFLQKVMVISEELNDRRRWEDGSVHMAYAYLLQGELADCLSLAEQIHESSLRSDDDRGRANALLIRALCLVHLGRLDLIPEIIDELSTLRRETWEEVQTRIQLLQARIQWQQGEYESAIEKSELFLGRIGEISMTYESLPQYMILADIISLALESPDPRWRNELSDKALRVCRHLKNQARFFPVGNSAAALAEGMRLWFAGKHGKAFQKWHKSLEHAQVKLMRYDEAKAHYQIGRHLESGDNTRTMHLKKALKLFTQIGAVFDIENTTRELTTE